MKLSALRRLDAYARAEDHLTTQVRRPGTELAKAPCAGGGLLLYELLVRYMTANRQMQIGTEHSFCSSAVLSKPFGRRGFRP